MNKIEFNEKQAGTIRIIVTLVILSLDWILADIISNVALLFGIEVATWFILAFVLAFVNTRYTVGRGSIDTDKVRSHNTVINYICIALFIVGIAYCLSRYHVNAYDISWIRNFNEANNEYYISVEDSEYTGELSNYENFTYFAVSGDVNFNLEMIYALIHLQQQYEAGGVSSNLIIPEYNGDNVIIQQFRIICLKLSGVSSVSVSNEDLTSICTLKDAVDMRLELCTVIVIFVLATVVLGLVCEIITESYYIAKKRLNKLKVIEQ
jgi:hypothetical protein